MKKIHINLSVLLLLSCALGVNVQAQSNRISKVNKQLDESAVVAGTQALVQAENNWRSTGASYTITGADLEKMGVSNLLNALNARIPGLTVIAGSGETGYDSPSLAVRGQSSWNTKTNNMLVYLDGYPTNLESLVPMSANEIETVTVMMDASELSRYGFSGDGMISVVTKKGVIGKTKISFNARYGAQSAVQLPTVLNAYDYTRLYNEARVNDGLPEKYADPTLYQAKNDPAHPNVDWYDEMLKPSSPIQNYNISFRGGSDKAKFFVLLDHANYSGLYKNADQIDNQLGTNAEYKKYNIRANVGIQINKNLYMHAEVTGKIEDRNTPSGFTATGLFNALLNTPAAAFPVKNPNGTWATTSQYTLNPVYMLKEGGIYNGHTRSMQANFGFDQKLDAITKGLSLNGGISFSNQYKGQYYQNYYAKTYEIIKDANDMPVFDTNGNYTYSTHGSVSSSTTDNESTHWLRTNMQAGLGYNRTFGLHTITANTLAKREVYSYLGLTYEYRTQGISTDVTYDYDQKYILSASLGYMGTASLGTSKFYGLFPSVGAAWVLTKEDFLKDNDAINYLKLKASYGTSGSLDQDYRFKDKQWATYTDNVYKTGTTTASNQAGRSEGAIGNKDFSWETKRMFNVGVDATLFKNFNATVNVFNEKRTGIIENYSASIPLFAGFVFPYLNSGEVTNKGFDGSLRYNGKVSDFEYYAGLSASFARNKIDKMAEDEQPASYLYDQGYRIGQFRGLQNVGYYETSDFDANGNLNSGVVVSSYTKVKAGDLKYKDQNGDGVINDFDMKPMGYSSLPEWTFGLNLGFKYKGFDFDTYIEGVTNRTVSMPAAYTQPFVDGHNITKFALNAWTPETAATATSPRLTTQTNSNNAQNSDFWMRDGSFVKVRNLEIGYTIPQIGVFQSIEKVRVFANGTNLFMLDKIDDLEAENLSMGYPTMKSVSFGVNVVF